MKVFTATGAGKFAFADIAVPEVEDYEVLVKNEGCVICNSTEWMIVDRLFGTKDYPVVLGHESFGKVVKVGNKVRNFQLGDRVICSNAIPKGYDGKYYSTWGGFAEYGIAGDYDALIEDGQSVEGEYAYRKRYSANNKIDKNLPIEQACLVFPLAETASCILQVPELVGKDVAVFGTGMAGYTLAMFAKLGGANSVTIFGRRQERADKALEFGVDYAKISAQAYEEDKKYQVVFEATGNSEVYAKGMPFLEENGVLAVYAVSVTPYRFNLNRMPNNHTVRIVEPRVKSAVEFVQGLMAEGKIPVAKLLTHIWEFSQAEEAMWKVKNGEVIKGLVKIEEKGENA